MGAIKGARSLLLLVLNLQVLCVSAIWKYGNPDKYPKIPDYGPKPGPAYMVDNTKNYYNVAPDKGSQNGAVWAYSGSHDEFVSNLGSGRVMRGGFENKTSTQSTSFDPVAIKKRQSGSYWLEELGPLGSRVLRVTGSTDVVFLNLFTVAISEIAVGIDKTVVSKESNQRGFTTEISVWLPLDGADNTNPIFVGAEVWIAPTVSCSAESCLLIFPTSSLDSPSTISPSPFTTSFQYGGTSTVTQNGAVTVTFITTTTTTVLNIPPVTVDGMPYSNYNISSGQSTIDITPSVDVPPFTISLPDGNGSNTTRVVPLPPWPLIDDGPTGPSIIPVPSGNLPSGSGTFYTGITSTITVTGATVTTISFPGVITPTTVTCPPDDVIVFATPSTTFYTECATPTTFGIGFNCPTTKVVSFLGPTTGIVSVDCSVVTGFPPAETEEPPPPSETRTTPLPVWTTWPPGIITPISTTVEGPEPTQGGTKQSCKLWFFFVCISRDDLEIGGWFWSFPPGIYPPGPPPGIRWPSGFTLEGSLPPWPRITIGPGGELTYSEEPTECTTTQTASICTVSTTFSVTSDATTTATTATVTSKECETISGCSVSQSTTEGATTTIETCTIEPTGGARRRTPEPSEGHALQKRACQPVPVVIYPRDPTSAAERGQIRAALGTNAYHEARSNSLAGGYTAFFWVQSLPSEPRSPNLGIASEAAAMIPRGSGPVGLDSESFNLSLRGDPPTVNDGLPPSKVQLWKRAATSALSQYWNDALISLPNGQRWKSGPRGGKSGSDFVYYYDDSAGSGMTVYAVGEPGGVNTAHDEWSGRESPRRLDKFTYEASGPADQLHGTRVAAVINGAQLGVCKSCKVAYTGYVPASAVTDDQGRLFDPDPRDWYLEDLLKAWDDMESPTSSVINMSWGSMYQFWTPAFINRLYDILKRMDRAGVTLVVAAGNWGDQKYNRKAVDTYPQLFADPNNGLKPQWTDSSDATDLGYLENMIVVGATNQFGNEAKFSQTADFVTTFAAGDNLNAPGSSGNSDYEAARGTSFAAPQVAALAAYFKALPSKWQGQLNQESSDGPRAVKALISTLQRYITTPTQNNPALRRLMVWNGMDQSDNCLLENDSSNCPELPDDITACDVTALFAELLPRIVEGNETMIAERQDGGSCALPGGGGGGGTQITLTTGPTVSPTCANPDGCGGHICSGYWCAPTPTGFPPGYQDPKDPSSSSFSSDDSNTVNRWYFYAQTFGTTYDICNDGFQWESAGREEYFPFPENVPFPDGTFELETMLSTDGCVYEGTADAAGTLTCPDLTQTIQCFGYSRDVDIGELDKAGYESVAPALPSSNASPLPSDWSADLDTIQTTVRELIEAGRDVVVVMHSFSGMTGGTALNGLDKESRAAEGPRGGVVRLIYINAFLVPEDTQHSPPGTSDNMIPEMEANIKAGTVIVSPKNVKAMFHQDLDEKTSKEYGRDLRPHSLGSYWGKTKYAAWRHIPTSYIICTEDRPLTVQIIHGLIARATEEEHKIDN
ncbi:hypothetical protein E8E14_002289, partial [Neopestalotiopsis sp. 37M]